MRSLLIALPLLLLSVVPGLAQDAPKERPAEAPKYDLPKDAAFTAEDVKIVFDAGDAAKEWHLTGSFNLPTGEMPAGGWPAVFFISGSGMQDRHGLAGGMDLGTWQVLDAVANAGFAVLRVDDRATGGSMLGPKGTLEIGYHDLVNDARQCVKWLKAHEKVNKSRIFLIGHSEGGTTAPILAAEDESLAGIVFMAAPGRNMYDVIYMQVRENLDGKVPKSQIEPTMKVQKEFQDAVKENREPDFKIVPKKVWTDNAGGRKWMREHFNLDLPAIHAKVKCPCFITQGAADFQVRVEEDARLLASNLSKGQCKDLTLRVYDDLDHLFKPCGGRKSSLSMYTEKRDVDATFLKDLVAWLTARR